MSVEQVNVSGIPNQVNIFLHWRQATWKRATRPLGFDVDFDFALDVARVEPTLLSVAFAVDLAVDFDLDSMANQKAQLSPKSSLRFNPKCSPTKIPKNPKGSTRPCCIQEISKGFKPTPPPPINPL
jgi:hypothetical protein